MMLSFSKTLFNLSIGMIIGLSIKRRDSNEKNDELFKYLRKVLICFFYGF